MQKALIAMLAAALVVTLGFLIKNALGNRPTAETLAFTKQADDLIEGLQAYRKFVGSFPNGSSADIANDLSGKSEKKVLVMAARQENRNPKGEIVDPWGTPIQFFFSPSTVLIRSAGPNRTFEDASNPGSDDLFKTDAR